jgi:hypothetical protein
MSSRRHERFEVRKPVYWDFFTASSGARRGYIANISRSGCLLKTSEVIEHRRWLRLMVEGIEGDNVHYAAVGRVTRCENVIEAFGTEDVTLYRYGVEFTYPGAFFAQDADLIFDLSSRNLTVRSCRIRNSRSSRRP